MINPGEQNDPGSNTLELWADLYRKGAFRGASPPGEWQAADKLVRVAEAADDAARDHLAELLKISNQTFEPLADPLAIDFGAHRWLSGEREEAYSDWFEWILKQIADAGALLKLFEVQDEKLLLECASLKPTINREFTIDDGRPDLVVKFGNSLLVIVEIKTKWFDEDAVRDQLKRYAQWAKNQSQPRRCYFVSTGSGEFVREYGFEPLPWRELAFRMREQARRWVQASENQPLNGEDLIRAAMTLAFCGAAEQNLIGLSGKPGRFTNQFSAKYLTEWSARNGG